MLYFLFYKMEQYFKEAKYLSILVIVVGILLIIMEFLPTNFWSGILIKIIITFLIASGISFWLRNRKKH